MKVTFPHMGNVYIAIKALLDELNIDYIIPPFNNKRTLELGARFAPEGACLPLKITTGSIMQAHELGADTMIMLGSWGPCRFGYYCEMQKEILEDANCKMDTIILESCAEGLGESIRRVKKLTGHINPPKLLKITNQVTQIIIELDKLECDYYKVKARQRNKGNVDTIYQTFQQKALTTVGMKDIRQLIKETHNKIKEVKINARITPLRIGIVGEIYGTIDAYSSMYLQDRLANMGIETERKVTTRLWVVDHMIKKALHLPRNKRYEKAAEPYLRTNIGGHTRETLGHTILHAKDGFDGVIQLYPLGCMPEIVAQAILPTVSNDYDIPVLTLITDEMTGDNGYMTRIEAFVDLLEQRKNQFNGDTRRSVVAYS